VPVWPGTAWRRPSWRCPGACTNVYHHAGTADEFEVVVELGAERLTMDILDAGAGVAERHRNPTMPDASAENGRGLALMAAFSDRVTFDSVLTDGGSVHLMKTLRWNGDRWSGAAGPQP
jgi:anti-sigma regulatory factor (Ser/Thr protein kinase)